MITRIEALGYRCLRHISQPLGPFHVLVGPNASGKTTFLDVIAFLSRVVSVGVDVAIEERTQNFYDLLWRGGGTKFELAIEAALPERLRGILKQAPEVIRYEIVVGLDIETQEIGLLSEQVTLKKSTPALGPTQSVSLSRSRNSGYFDPETASSQTEIQRPFASRGLKRSALTGIELDDELFPATIWLGDLLSVGVQQIVLNSLQIRKPSPPGQGSRFRPDGYNLPWVVEDLRQRFPERFQQWISHLRTAFPDLEDVTTIERPEDRHRYLFLHYKGDFKVPSWMASDGTLKMLALTLPAYVEGFQGIYLIEEPENGIHPRAIETMTQSLSSVYDAQVLLATHSPVILNTVEAEQILCFSKGSDGSTSIVRGSEHPALQAWKHETTLGTLFAAGVLG